MGTGPHLCFLHGFCEDKSMWSDAVEYLQSDFTIITIDLPGFGTNSSPFTSIKDVAKEACTFIKSETDEEVILYGHSMGGYIALEMVKYAPNQFAALGMVHSTARPDSLAKQEKRDKLVSFLQNNGVEPILKTFIQDLVAEQHFDRLENDLWKMVKSVSKQAMIDASLAMKQRKDNLSLLPELDIPVHFVVGELDKFIDSTEALYEASLPQHCYLSYFEEGGHLSLWEEQKKCLTEVKHFCNMVVEITS